MMNYQEFLLTIQENILDYLPEKYAGACIEIKPVSKNNGVILDGLTVILPGSNIGPCIYLNELYKDYAEGYSMEQILSAIGRISSEREAPQNIQFEDFSDFKKVKDRICFQVVGEKQNHERLSGLPHRLENDLALIYQIHWGENENGILSTVIHNPLLKMWGGLTEQDLYDVAKVNTPRIFPATFRSMKDALLDMMISDVTNLDPALLSDEERLHYMDIFGFPDSELEAQSEMYVLSNKQNVKGATSLFYPGIQEAISAKLGGNYYVLPSSVHECVILPCDERMSLKELKELVKSVNEDIVSPQEVLSAEVYLYDKCAKELTAAEMRKFSLVSQIENAESKKEVSKTDNLISSRHTMDKNDISKGR